MTSSDNMDISNSFPSVPLQILGGQWQYPRCLYQAKMYSWEMKNRHPWTRTTPRSKKRYPRRYFEFLPYTHHSPPAYHNNMRVLKLTSRGHMDNSLPRLSTLPPPIFLLTTTTCQCWYMNYVLELQSATLISTCLLYTIYTIHTNINHLVKDS